MGINEKIEQLSTQIAELAQQHTSMSRRLIELMDELERLKREAAKTEFKPEPQAEIPNPLAQTPNPIGASIVNIPEPASKAIEQVSERKENAVPLANNAHPPTTPAPNPALPPRAGLEEFIGGNLASKAGILITLIGIFIGAKYAIEHEMVSPLVRIIAGYICGLVLIGIAWRLKNRYEQYSAVLMGGGLAAMYFITYIAYSFYALLPQLFAFALMLVFTVAAVYAALLYNRVIIALLGLVGAYAIPILLSNNSGRYDILFTYITIINTGILFLSFKKYWKLLFHIAFVITWLIYGVFYINAEGHFTVGMVFLCIFFLLFYATFLAYKLIKKEQFSARDVVLLLSNAFIFYGYGYGLLSDKYNSVTVLALFTLANAAIHFTVSMIVKKLQLADKALFYLLLGLVIAFITIAIPVQLDGNWVTLLWTIEALIVFFVGRTQNRSGYEKLAIVLTVIAFISLMDDWTRQTREHFFFNANFFTGIIVSAGFGAMLYVHHRYKPALENKKFFTEFYNLVLPLLFLAAAYFTFELEIYYSLRSGPGLLLSAVISLYSMAFVAVVSCVNLLWIRNRFLAASALLASLLCIAILLVHQLPVLNAISAYTVRYASIAMAAILLLLGQRAIHLINADNLGRNLYVVVVQVTILSIISFEYLQWMNVMGTTVNEYKLGLSILWSVYALALVVLGISKKKKYWRLTGIFFFIITLIKLFVYDLSQATTISKTISFISLGAILLLVSYLYNRYKGVILEDDEEERN